MPQAGTKRIDRHGTVLVACSTVLVACSGEKMMSWKGEWNTIAWEMFARDIATY